MKPLLCATFLLTSLVVPACNSEKEPTPEELAQQLESDLREAEARLRNGKAADAEKIYLRILATDQEHPIGLAGMAGVRMEERDYKTAQVLLDRAIAAGNNEPKTHFLLGETYRLREMYAESVDPYRKAWEITPDNSSYGLTLGRVLNRSKQYQEAEKILRAVGELDPNAQFVWTELGDAVREQGRMEDALKLYMKAQNTYESDKLARAGAARVYEALGDNKHALDEWSAYLRMDCCSEFSDNVAKKKVMELKVVTNGGEDEAQAEAPADAEG